MMMRPHNPRPFRPALIALTLVVFACSENKLHPSDSSSGDSQDLDSACPTPGCADPDTCDVAVTEARDIPTIDGCDGDTPPEVLDPWANRTEYQFDSGGIGPFARPTVINLTDDNADGTIDSGDIPDIVFTVYGSDELIAISGDYSGELFRRYGWRGSSGVAAADIDGDGVPEICGFNTSAHPQCADNTGAVLWTTPGTNANEYEFADVTFCDLDQDGNVEVIADNQVIDGEDGTTAFDVPAQPYFSVPICADLDQDGTGEFIVGDTVYDHTGVAEWAMGGSTSTRMTAILDADADGRAEVVLADDALYLYEDDGTLIWSVPFEGINPGPPCVADFDGDTVPEIAVVGVSSIWMYGTDGALRWETPIEDPAGSPSCSGFDLNGDTVPELLVADTTALRILDGATGALRASSVGHESNTFSEYPVVVDVDKDGAAEIVLAENYGATPGILVYGHDGAGWPAAGHVWATHDYAVTNVDEDGAVPAAPVPSWLTDNAFRSLPPMSTPDLTGDVVDVCAADCDNGPIEVSFEVRNQGDTDVDAGTPWSFYKNDDGVRTWVTSGTLDAVRSGRTLDSGVVAVAPADIGTTGFEIVLDDDGSGGAFVSECDETNNTIAFTTDVCD